MVQAAIPEKNECLLLNFQDSHSSSLPSAETFSYFKEALEHDLELIRQTPDLASGVIKMPITVYLGKKDKFCLPSSSLAFWSQKSLGGVLFYTYDGDHLPCQETLELILKDTFNTSFKFDESNI